MGGKPRPKKIKPLPKQVWFDWEELLDHFGCSVKNEAEDEAIDKFFREAADKFCSYKPEYVAGVRKLFKDLASSKYDYLSPVWQSLADLEHEETLMRIAFPLFKYAWN